MPFFQISQTDLPVALNSAFKNTMLKTIFISVISSFNVSAQEQGDYFCGAEIPKESLSIESIIPALYNTVSGDAGSKKNWSLLKQLHSPSAIITPLFHENGFPTAKISSVDEFIALNEQIFKDINFYEKEVASKIFVYGHMATILSHYESRDDINAAPYSQGINSFQLLNDGRRWCVVSVTWDSDKGGHPIEIGLFK
jgi:hypothetical protein